MAPAGRRTNGRTVAFVVALLVGAALVGAGLSLAGAATAATGDTGTYSVTTNTSEFSDTGNDTLLNETVEVDNDTRSIYVELDVESDESTDPVNVTVYRVEDNASDTQLEKAQLDAASGETELYEYQSVNSSETYRVTVEGNDSATPEGALTIGTVKEVAGIGGGGGSLSLDGSIYGVPVPAVIGAAVLVLLFVARD